MSLTPADKTIAFVIKPVLFIACLVTISVAWLAQQIIGPALVRSDAGQRAALVKPSSKVMRNAIVLGLATFMALASALLLALRGVGSSADIFADWANQFQFTRSSYLITGPFAVLARHEVGLLLVGLPAAVWAAPIFSHLCECPPVWPRW